MVYPLFNNLLLIYSAAYIWKALLKAPLTNTVTLDFCDLYIKQKAGPLLTPPLLKSL